MKQDKKEKRNNILYSVLGLVLGIAMCGIGIYGMILNRIESQEYKNTTDKREVIAVVESCREIDNSDDKDKNKKNSRSVKYRTKLAFEVDGKAYEGEETYNQKVYVGDKVKRQQRPCMHKRVELKSAQTVKPRETQNVHA